MPAIALTRGFETIVDEDDFGILSSFKWYAHSQKGGFRAARAGPVVNGKLTIIQMHRFIMNPGSDMVVDHINHDPLDNRRANLRVCTRGENNRNTSSQIGKSSNYLGVGWHGSTSKWRARIKIDGKDIHLGTFGCERQAALRYNDAALSHFGQFASLNNI